jgi:hypothetical protein
MTAAAEIITYLEARRVQSALIGGIALGAHGVARATLDVDLLVADRGVLVAAFWPPSPPWGALDIRHGDTDDPLVGVVRFAGSSEPVDVIVGHSPWTVRILERRMFVEVSGHRLPIVDRTDLILLKLFAAGPQDLLDVRLLVAADPTGREEIERRLNEAPARIRTVWNGLQRNRS